MADNRHFLSNFVNGFMQAREARLDRMEREELKKVQIKMFKNQLEDEDKKRDALRQIESLMGGLETQPQNFTGPPQTVPKKSLLDLLSDPQGQKLLMQSGTVGAKDIIEANKSQTPFDISKLPPGMGLTRVKLDSSGRPMYDFGFPEAGKEVKDPTGRNIITLDKNGRPISDRAASPEEISLTPAQKAIDTKFAEEYTNFTTAGGYADVQKGVGQLNEALAQLKKSETLSGPVIGGVSDKVLKFTNPKAIAVREDVEEVVQKNLRLILGPQFTEKEGERLIARAYNPNLEESENITRLERLIKQIQGAAQAKMEAIKYYEDNGTLAGFKGKVPQISDFDVDSNVSTESKVIDFSELPE
jgi:hypothetical protein